MTSAEIKREMQLMGLTPRHKGFFYISGLLTELMGRDGGAGMKLPRTEERCMRYAINYAWDINEGCIHDLFPDRGMPPTPTEFIYAMLWRMDE